MGGNTNTNPNVNNNGEKKEFEDKQIVRVDGKNKILEVNDKLKKGDGPRKPLAENSKLELCLVDYTNKDKGQTVTVRFNLDPHDIHEMRVLTESNFADFAKFWDKIFGDPDESGLSPARKLCIAKESMRGGKPASSPWKITITNGKAKKIKTATGGYAMEKDSFVQEAQATIYLTGAGARQLFNEAESFIERAKTMFSMESMVKEAANEVVSKVAEQQKTATNWLYSEIGKQIKDLKEVIVPDGMPTI